MINRIGPDRILQVGAQNGWDGYTPATRVAAANSNTSASTTVVSGTPAQAFGSPISFEPADLHRPLWIASGLLLREEIALLAAPGGGGKTALVIALLVTLSAGLTHFGPFPIEGQRPGGLKVLYISAEENKNSVARLVAAACRALALNAAQRALVTQNFRYVDAAETSWVLGAARPSVREDIAPEDHDQAFQELAALTDIDVVVLDTMAALFALPNEIDNQAITVRMRRLGKAARRASMAVLLIHHTPKLTRAATAELRGEHALIRGGGAIINSARVVLTLTSLPDGEAAQLAAMGCQPDRTRRLEHSKLNDGPFMAPSYLALRSELVKVSDGSEVAVRAIEWIPTPTAGSSITNAVRNLVMRTVDAGTTDDRGAKVSLSPSSGGHNNRRDGTKAIAEALMRGNGILNEPQAKHLARQVLDDLKRTGCVVDQEVQAPRYKPDGQRDGSRKVRGLVCRWELAPWHHTPAADTTSTTEPAGGEDA